MKERKRNFLPRFFAVVALGWAVLIPAASQAEKQAAIREFTFTAVDFDFKGPEKIPQGLITVRIANEGKELHHVQLVKLSEGKTAEDLRAAIKASSSDVLPAWAKYAGGPNAVMPGEEGVATVRLSEGRYAVICIIPDEKGNFHSNLGMVRPLTVTPEGAGSASEPGADLSIDTVNFGFVISSPVKPGPKTIRVKNTGSIPHEVVVVQLDAGASAQDFVAAFEPGASGPPPGKPIGGMAALESGAHGFFSADFSAGRHALICFFSEPGTGKLHYALGMMKEFTVE